MLACRRFCKSLSHAYEALWSPSCDSTWSLTSARAARTAVLKKLVHLPGKPFSTASAKTGIGPHKISSFPALDAQLFASAQVLYDSARARDERLGHRPEHAA
jgi:hypothetical protein